MFDFAARHFETQEDNIRGIKGSVSLLFRRVENWFEIKSVEQQWEYIEIMRQRYVFPDYLSLVGEPSEDDFGEEHDLTIKRKAELLLVGAFDWQGLVISREVSVSSYKPYGRDWADGNTGWHVALEPVPNKLSYKSFFLPFDSIKHEPLERYLLSQNGELSANQKVCFRDKNVFNCQPDNLVLKSALGRPMRCTHCRKITTNDESRRFKLQGQYYRYCLSCMDKLGDHTLSIPKII